MRDIVSAHDNTVREIQIHIAVYAMLSRLKVVIRWCRQHEFLHTYAPRKCPAHFVDVCTCDRAQAYVPLTLSLVYTFTPTRVTRITSMTRSTVQESTGSPPPTRDVAKDASATVIDGRTLLPHLLYYYILLYDISVSLSINLFYYDVVNFAVCTTVRVFFYPCPCV